MTSLSRIEDLTNESLSRILGPAYKTRCTINDFQLDEIDSAVLSKVIAIMIDTNDDAIPKNYIIKFLKPELPLPHMFCVETEFYQCIARQEVLPFKIPNAVHCSESCILLERVENVQNYTVLGEACVETLVIPIIQRLARFHAQFWKHSCENLASPAGIGSALDGPSKDSQFPLLWSGFVNQVADLSTEQRRSLSEICDKLSQSSLTRIHEYLHDNQQYWTMIHGDFHLGNMLFRDDDVWLIDWATCGRGNPLRDFVFFMVVSLEASQTNRSQYLAAYVESLTEFESVNLDRREIEKAYRLCVINQFAILVCYDKFSRELAESQKSEVRTKLLKHFERVNRRCSLALLSCFEESDLSPKSRQPHNIESTTAVL